MGWTCPLQNMQNGAGARSRLHEGGGGAGGGAGGHVHDVGSGQHAVGVCDDEAAPRR